MKKLTCMHFIPLIGPYIAAANANSISTKRIFSFEIFKDNEQHIPLNYDVPAVEYLPYGKNTDYSKLFKDVESTDFMFSIPPCAGLSMMTSGADEKHRAAMNQFMLEAVKAYLASGCKILMFENAWELTQFWGLKMIEKICKILPTGYKVHIIKCSSLNHGLPQHRRRCFVYIYKSRVFYLPKVKKQSRIAWYNFLKRPERYATEKEIKEGSLHFPSKKVFSKFHEPMLKYRVYDSLRKKQDETKRNKMSLFRLIRNEKVSINTLLPTNCELKKLLKDIKSRRACWDSSPIVCNSYTGAVTKKNCMSLIHPRYDRPLSYREVMDLMGLPDDFKMVDAVNLFNHVCQNIPIPTVTAYVAAATDILTGKASIYQSEARVLMQDNVKGRLSVLHKGEWERYEEYNTDLGMEDR